MQAFVIFSNAFHLSWLPPIIACCIILGGLSGVGAWIIGPTKGLLVASQDGSLPTYFAKTNGREAPIRILVLQAIIVSVLSLIYILMPTINSSYWILSVITAQLALIVYVILFAAGIKLHYKKPHIQRSFRIPGKKIGIWLVCGMGAISCLVVILFGFLPPDVIPFNNIFLYELILIAGIVVCSILPLFFLNKPKN
jgi:glutamate:GABA antiporter